MSRLAAWSDIFIKAEKMYGLDMTKIHLLGIADKFWDQGDAVRVTELINKYSGASRATTHKAIKELIDAELLRVVNSTDDGRVRYLHPGKKLKTLEKLL